MLHSSWRIIFPESPKLPSGSPHPVCADEPMAGQNNSGSYSLDVKNDSIISSNIIFRGSVLRQIEEKRKPRKYIYIGSMHVDVT